MAGNFPPFEMSYLFNLNMWCFKILLISRRVQGYCEMSKHIIQLGITRMQMSWKANQTPGSHSVNITQNDPEIALFVHSRLVRSAEGPAAH